MKHHITKYWADGKQFAESWLQVNVFGKNICLFKKRIEL